uniref:RNase H type-1 domain-containing protein n=1 Tax=Ananas comosus var. bracteatus TaxID=296719 RepID=A0A6V7NXI0_ANACO|nr:unnamed protein product [Ananas comosus var. bracteatus]
MMEFDITYVSQKAVKRQALADFLAAHPLPDDSPLITDLPDEEVMTTEHLGPHWQMYFDGASRTIPVVDCGPPRRKAGAGIVFVTPTNGVIYHSFSLLKQECSNNEAEYEALICGLITALNTKIFYLHVYGDSQLVIQQVLGVYEVRKLELVPYHRMVCNLMKKFCIYRNQTHPTMRNVEADALAKLVAALTLPLRGDADIHIEQRFILPSMLDILPEWTQLHQLLDLNSDAVEYQLHQLLDLNSDAAEYQPHQLLDLNSDAAEYQPHQLLDLNSDAAEYQPHQLLDLNSDAASTSFTNCSTSTLLSPAITRQGTPYIELSMHTSVVSSSTKEMAIRMLLLRDNNDDDDHPLDA